MGDRAMAVHMTDIEHFRLILEAAEEAGIIEGYDRCPGTNRYDIEVTDTADGLHESWPLRTWLQVEVIGELTGKGS